MSRERPRQIEQSTTDEEEVCRRFAKRIWAYGVRHLGDEAEAADLTQQVLMIVVEALRENRIHDRDRIDSFVLGTCRLVVLDLNRARSRRELALEKYGREVLDGVVPSIDSPDFARLFQCLHEVEHRARRVLVMTFYENLSADEIAVDLQTSPGNVRVLRHRSLAQLRECLERPSCGGSES